MDIQEENLNRWQSIVKSKNPNKKYPSNLGKKWTEQEETLLLTELDNNIDIEIIAEKHNRTKGSIVSRQKEIAYKMSIKNISMIEIVNKTKLDEITINEYIGRKLIEKKGRKPKGDKVISKELTLENEIIEIKNDIKELKNTLKELVGIMNSVYEFENS